MSNGGPLAQAWDGTIPKPALTSSESGRRRRGQLESMVDTLCKTWLVIGTAVLMPEDCTAEWLTERAAAMDGLETSSGAVAAILHRWERMGYAQIRKKPLRFIGFTAHGLEVGFEELRRRERRRARGDYDTIKMG